MKVEPLYLTWLNNLGGFDYFLFIAWKDYNVDIRDSGSVKQNILSNWPNSYGSNADTIEKQTYRISKNSILVRSQFLTPNQLEALIYIKTSTLVQIMNSRHDRTTVLVDTDSFKKYSEDEKIYKIQFTLTMTNEIPSQRL